MNMLNEIVLRIEIVLHRLLDDLAHLCSQLPGLAASVAAAAEIIADKTLACYQSEQQRLTEHFLQSTILGVA